MNLSRFGKNAVNSIVPFFDVFYLLSPAKNEALDVDRQASTQAANLGTPPFFIAEDHMFYDFQRKQRRDHSSPTECKGGREEGGKGGGGVHNVIGEHYGRSKVLSKFYRMSPPPPIN